MSWRMRLIAGCFMAGLVLMLSLSITRAQEDAWVENFDDPGLPGWEHSPDVAVVDGVLRLEPGNFAAHGGDWADFTLAASVWLASPEGVAVIYHVGESGSHILVINNQGYGLQRESGGQVTQLATAVQTVAQQDWVTFQLVVTDDTHVLMLGGTEVLSASDPGSPVTMGGIGFESLGGVVEIDNLTLTAGPAATPLPIPDPAQVLANVPGVWARTGGPPGGLGYDIRYNFVDPNIWYVTDNFAGVHISTDNGATWQPSNTGIPAQLGPTGEWRPIFSLTVDPLNPQTLWVGTDITGHIYKSTDSGQTWQQKDNGIVNEWDELTFRGFTVDPRSSDTVYAMGETSIVAFGGHLIWSQGDGGVIYKTMDGGESWTKIWDGGIPSALARYMWINPANPDVMYVSTGIFDRGAVNESTDYNTDPDPWGGLGVLKSTDGGQTWRILGKDNGLAGLYVGSLYMHPQNPDILLAAVGHEMGFAQIDRLRVEGNSPAGIYRTTDGGETWTHAYQPSTERPQEEFSAVEICTSDPDIAYAGSGSAIYRSTDVGVTWTQMTPGDIWGPPGVRAGWPIDLQCDPRNTNRLFANNYQGGAFLSEDGGATWANASQGYTGAQVYDIVVDPLNSARIYVIGRSGGWRSDDGGTTWVGLRNFIPGEPQPTLAEWGTIALNPANPDQIWASDGDGSVIIRSQDRGTSWTVHIPPEGVQGTVKAYAFTPADPNTIYAGFGDLGCARVGAPCTPAGGVIVSRDNGQTWTLTSETLLSATIAELAVDPTNPQIVYAAATEAGLFKTADGGNSWNKIELGDVVNIAVADPDMLFAPEYLQFVALDPGNPQHVLISVYLLGIYASYDGGSSWQAAYAGLEPNGSINAIVFDPTNPQIVYASDRASGVYRSTDGGLTWLKINDGLENRAAMGLAISADGQQLYLTTDGAGVFHLNVTH